MFKKGYGFVKVFDIFDVIDNKSNKLNKYKCRMPTKNDAKNVVLEYFKIMEDRLIDMPSTPWLFEKETIPNGKEMSVINSNTKWTNMSVINSNTKRKIKIHVMPKQFLILLNSRKSKGWRTTRSYCWNSETKMAKKTETEIETLIPKKLLTRPLSFNHSFLLLAQIKAGNNSYKSKNKVRQILYTCTCINTIKSQKKIMHQFN